MSSSQMTREELLLEVISLGELPPRSWSNAEIRVRMEELRESYGLPANPKTKEITPLRAMMVQLNQASNKKETLVRFLKEDLGLVLSANETMVTLKKKGVLAAYDKAMPSGEDPVGFGVHASLTYQEVALKEPSYCQWIQNTYQEGTSDARLARLARWLQSAPEIDPKQEITPIPSQWTNCGHRAI